jgi:DNA-binding NarL/FixJ family response regulator
MTVRVAIVEDQQDIREGLRFLINGTAGYSCTGCFASMEHALADFPTDAPDVVLMDLGLPGMSGLEGIRVLKERHPSCRVVALTVYEDDEKIFQALCAGASGYLLKKTPPAQLLECLQDVVNGGGPMSPEVAARVIELFRQAHAPAVPSEQLTPHEVRVLKLLADGHSYKTAAAELGSSANTVAFHLKNIYVKLQVHSKSEAVAKALRTRILR